MANHDRMRAQPVSRRSSTQVLSVDAAKSLIVASGIAYWNALRGTRRFPARSELSPRAMATFLKHVAIIEVVDSGADYRYSLVGDAHVEARGADFSGATLRSIAETSPDFAARTRELFDTIRQTGEPCVISGSMDPNASDWRFGYRECAFLPLGREDRAVDGLLAVGVYAGAAPTT